MVESQDGVNKLFLQAMMNRAIVKKTTALSILKHCAQLLGYALQVKESDLTSLLNEINPCISKFGMSLKMIRSESDMVEYLVLVNIIDHSNTFEKLNHIYSAKEREFFRRTLEMMIINPESYGTVRTIDCINMGTSVLKASDIEVLINKLLSDFWFLKTAEGALCPGPRCIAEFEVFFQSHYKDHISVCPLCNNVAFFGASCAVCETISHKYCVIKYNKGSENPKCVCKNTFPEDTISKEDIELANAESRERSRMQNGHCESTPVASRRSFKRNRD